MVTQDYNAAFEVFLRTLNPEQRQAVDQIDGPLMVVAGPGTGKTQVLAARIGRILTETDTPAASILCLTFSDAGAHAMRQRLLQLIGPDAYRVTVSTFHSFCNRVISENIAYFGSPHLTLISELERIELVRGLLLEQPADHPLLNQRKDPYAFEKQLGDLFSLMKKEGWTPRLMEQHIDRFVLNLEQHPDFVYKRNSKYGRKGEPNQSRIREAREKMERLRAAVLLYPAFEDALSRRSRYEYDDMLLWVTDAFSRHEGLLRTQQERYLYILVDEYQDTNGAQYLLLQQLLDFWEYPNAFIVGDDDQSVYEFQGARLYNLIDFQRKYCAGASPLVLTRNYRSGQNILDAAGRLIAQNNLRAVRQLPVPLEKNLLAQREEQAELRVLAYDNMLHEFGGVAGRIQDLVREGVQPHHIAVLYTRHKLGEPLLRLLQHAGIPCRLRKQVDVLRMPVIEQFVDMLRYLNAEIQRPFEGEGLLFRLLHAPYWNLPSLDLALLALYCRQNPAAEGALRWRRLLQNAESMAEAGVGDAGRLLAAGQSLENWIQRAAHESLPGLTDAVWVQSGLLQYVMQHPDRVWLLQAVGTFQDFVGAELMRRPELQLADLVRMIDGMLENRLELPMHATIQANDGVQLLTAHASKGLEFDYVFMPLCTAEAWEPSARQVGARFALPDTLSAGGEEDALEARRRLFYVSMTRARRGLFLSYSLHNDAGKDVSRTRFIDETGLPVEVVPPFSDQAMATRHTLLDVPTQPVVQLPEHAWLDQRVQQFTISITALNRYLRCPLAFYYEDILKAPTPVRPAAAFGQVVHAALQHYFLKYPSGGSADALLRDFDAEMHRRRGFFAPAAFAQQLQTGKSILQRFHQERSSAWQPKAVVERRIDRCAFQGVPITGAIDRIEWLPDESLALIDFKTGKPDRKKVKGPSEKEPLGGEFWRQLLFYAVLVRESGIFPGAPVREGTISWVEPDPSGRLVLETLEYRPTDLAFMENLIVEVYSAVQHKAFDKGCGKKDCPWCALFQNTAATAMPVADEALMDDDGYLRADVIG